jgi:hypothetical protein
MINECPPVFEKCRLVPHGYLSTQFPISPAVLEPDPHAESRASTEKRSRVPGTLERNVVQAIVTVKPRHLIQFTWKIVQ